MLSVQSVSKVFDGFQAVKSISFEAKPGEILGFLGPNGAGKSTTMKMITGFLTPTHGDVLILNHSITKATQMAQKHIGYMPENAPLYGEMYVEEFLYFIASMREIKEDEVSQKIDDILKLCSLTHVRYQQIDTLSKGFKRRVSLAQALLHDPEILILDEPTDGLDPNQKHEVRKLIRILAQKKCILISTHILEEVEELCDRCIIIGQGEKLFEGTPDELKAMSPNGKIHDVFRKITTEHEQEMAL